MIQLVQLCHARHGRCVAVVQDDTLYRLSKFTSVYDLALTVASEQTSLETLAREDMSSERLGYDEIYNGASEWKLLPSFDHPQEPARCLVAGTGLTHMASAANRQAMHEQTGKTEMTDSMKMFQWGVEGGKPETGVIGVQPEWFYKGNGATLRGHGETLCVPDFAGDGGEEPEIAGVYVIDREGRPCRVGFTKANEFSDHIMEKKNYLYLAPSKLRMCAIGPELVSGADFADVTGRVSVERGSRTIWSKTIKTGETNMSHNLANLEHHHFKYPLHRRPGDAHVYFFGADAFSFGAGVSLEEGDVMTVDWQGFGRPLCNTISLDRSPETSVQVLGL